MASIRMSSQERWRASAAEKRFYGGSTVTRFFAIREGDEDKPARWLSVVGYGPTPGQRATYAKRIAEVQFEKRDVAEREARVACE